MHRNTWTLSPGRTLAALLIAPLALFAPMAARAAAPTHYTYQALAQIGGMAGEVPIPPGLIWILGPLTDDGQLVVDAGTPKGTQSELLLQYAGGKFTPLVAGGMDGPVGPWPNDIAIAWPPSMNARGDSAFNVSKLDGTPVGAFSVDALSGKMTAIVSPGMTAIGNLTFTYQPGYYVFPPEINDQGEIALTFALKGTGRPFANALFFRTPDGALQPILSHGQALPDGTNAGNGYLFVQSINDAGAVAFLVQRSGELQDSAYQWEKGNVRALVTVGMVAPGGGKIAAVSSVLLNSQNPSALISAHVAGAAGHGLYRLAGSTLTAVAVPGRVMPGGGKLESIPHNPGGGPESTLSISAATAAGQHAFVATLDDNSTGVYRLDADNTLALIAKTGMTTPLGTITHFGPVSPPAMNSQGQVVISASFDNGPDTLVLLTPAAP